MSRLGFGVLALAGLAVFAGGEITFYQGASQIQVVFGTAKFSGLKTFDPLQDYQEAGLILDVDDFAFEDFRPPGFPDGWGPFYYPNGGVNEMVSIRKADGGDFDLIEMNVSNGFGGGTSYLWIRAFFKDAQVEDWDADVTSGTLIGLRAGTSDYYNEVRIAAYIDAATRDLHDPAGFQAIALDNVSHGAAWAKCDTNCDGKIDAFDIDPFVLALTDPAGYIAAYPACDISSADINGDGKVDAFDIDPFVQCIILP